MLRSLIIGLEDHYINPHATSIVFPNKYCHQLENRVYHIMYCGTSLFATLILAVSGITSALDCKCVSFQTNVTSKTYFT